MKRRTEKWKIAAGVAILILLAAAIAAGSRIIEKREKKVKKNSDYDEETSVQWTEENTLYFNGTLYGYDHRIESFLFMGTDNSGNEEGTGEDYHGAMADYLLLMVLDHTDRTWGCIQIDRNAITSVNVLEEDGSLRTIREQQICTAHWYGSNKEMSAQNQVDSVKFLLGELGTIDGYYVLNMKDISTLNSLVDGVEVTFQEDMTDVDPVFVKGTTLTLTDEQAEEFMRSRMSLKDPTNAARMTRQKQYMDGFFQKVKRRVATDAKFAQTFWTTFRKTAVTDMNGNALSRIAQMILKGEDKGILRLDGKTKIGKVLDDGLEHEEFYPSKDSIYETVDRLYSLVPVEE